MLVNCSWNHFLKAVRKWVLNNSNISVRWFCDFKVMAGISDVCLRLTFSHSTLQGVGVRLALTGWGWKTLHALNLWRFSDLLGLWEGGSLCPPSVLCWLSWEGDTGFLLRSGTQCFLSKGFCLARLHQRVFGQGEQSFLETLKTTSSSIGLFRLSDEVFDVLCQALEGTKKKVSELRSRVVPSTCLHFLGFQVFNIHAFWCLICRCWWRLSLYSVEGERKTCSLPF